VQFPWKKISIGNSTALGDEVILYSLGQIKIGDDDLFSTILSLHRNSRAFSETFLISAVASLLKISAG
jgi:hypothetical protein